MKLIDIEKEIPQQIKAMDKYDEDDEECRNCTHFYWCEDCNDYHCEKAIWGDGICKYEPEGEEE